MNKLTKALCIIFAIVMVAYCAVIEVSASSSYQTYTYSISGYPLLSPDAYTPDRVVTSDDMGLADPLDGGVSDVFTDDDGNIYLADANKNRVICLDRYYKVKFEITNFVNSEGVPSSLSGPKGVFVTDKNIWVCDTGNHRLVVFDKKGGFDRIIQAPESTLFENDAIYTPVALAIDQYERIFVVSSTTQEGIIMMTSEGEFTGFIGAQAVTVSTWDALWKKLRTEEQQAQQALAVSTEFNNITVNDDGFVYVTTSSIKETSVQDAIQGKSKDGAFLPVKMLNSSGGEIMKRNGFWPPAGEINYSSKSLKEGDITGVSTIVDVAIGPEGTWSIIDQKRSKIYTYDDNGSLLYAFGDIGSMMGNVTQNGLAGITYQDSKIIVLDQQASKLVVYKRTEYGDILIDALAAENRQEFDQAIGYWTEILQRNSNFDAAYVGIGQAMYRNGEYEDSLEQFEAAYDTQNWSKSFKEIRKEWMSNFFILLILIIVAVIAAFIFFFKFINKVNKKATHSGKKKTFGQELAYGFHLILHPFDGFWDLKHEKRGSIRASLVYIAITILAFYYQGVGSGYLSNPEGLYSSLFNQAISVLAPLALFVISNWCLTTLFDGEGSLKDIFIASSYSLLPLPLLIVPSAIYANFATLEELDIVSMFYTIALVWLGLLLFFGTMVTHDYTMGKNVITVAGTLIFMIFIMFVAILFSTLVSKMLTLVTDIVSEIQYRL